MTRGRSAAAATVLGAVVAAVVVAIVMASPADQPASAGAGLAPPPRPALRIGAPDRLAPAPHASVWTVATRPATARAAPGVAAGPVAPVATRTAEGTAGTLLVLDRRRAASGRVWVEVRLPVLPNGTTGWLPRDAVGGYHRVDTRLIVDRARRRATLLRGGRVALRAPVGIGRPAWPTPRGRFYIRSRLTRYGGGFYGPLAFGTSARSAVLTDWPAGGFVGIHGTNRPDLIPGAVSHGCVRMRNADILRLGKLMPVGTPLEIR